MIGLAWVVVVVGVLGSTWADECSLTPVVHVLYYPGCTSKLFPSFACQGRCTSYVQVSGSKLWQTERSCMCCQESGERETSVTLSCPNARPGQQKKKQIRTRAPIDCMCRPCTDVEEGTVLAQEIANFMEESPMDNVPFLNQRLTNRDTVLAKEIVNFIENSPIMDCVPKTTSPGLGVAASTSWVHLPGLPTLPAGDKIADRWEDSRLPTMESSPGSLTATTNPTGLFGQSA